MRCYFVSLNSTLSGSLLSLALLIEPRLAESLPYFGKDMDLSLACDMEEGTMQTIQFKYELDGLNHGPIHGVCYFRIHV